MLLTGLLVAAGYWSVDDAPAARTLTAVLLTPGLAMQAGLGLALGIGQTLAVLAVCAVALLFHQARPDRLWRQSP